MTEIQFEALMKQLKNIEDAVGTLNLFLVSVGMLSVLSFGTFLYLYIF